MQSTVITHGCGVTQSCICDCVHLSVGSKTCSKLLFDLPGVSHSDFKIHTSTIIYLDVLLFFIFGYCDKLEFF